MADVNAARLRVTLQYVEPAPWRELVVPLSMTFKGLHDTIQSAFLWDDAHLWEFHYDKSIFGIPFDDGWDMGAKTSDANNARLNKLKTRKVSEFRYIYDMGDSWEHLLEVVELYEAPNKPVHPGFLKGEWRTPPEDIGGPPGFEYFLEVIKDPSHEEYEELAKWYGPDFDISDIGLKSIEERFHQLLKMRSGNTGSWQRG